MKNILISGEIFSGNMKNILTCGEKGGNKFEQLLQFEAVQVEVRPMRREQC